MEVNKIRLEKKGIESLLSPLEADVMKLLWKKEKSRVREIHASLKKDRKVALTSVAVILDRLHTRGMVSRTAEQGRGGTHYIYSANASKEGFEAKVIENTVEKLISSFGPVAVNYFNERFSKQ